MAEYDNTNSGVLFANQYKEQGDSRPDFVGNINVDGNQFKLAGWKNVSQGGKRYISVKVSEDTQEGQQEQKKQSEEELPF
jgi:uncharacterized protein (DUF736 family)|tara:strand:+ start:5831 stop:6070 length:240 start_codon:yes stop_codon:yes gene_type:complete